MSVTVDVSSLIQLRQYARSTRAKFKAKAAGIGLNASRWHGRGMDFSETRHYQIGDDSRHMEWRVTARTGRPHVKVFHEERERPIVILVDFAPSMYFGTRVAFKSVIAARLAALLAWTGSAQGDRVGGLLCSATKHCEFIPKNRQAGVLPLLSGLAEYTQNHPHNDAALHDLGGLKHALKRLQRVSKPGSLLVLISDFYTYDNETIMQLNRLRRHNDVIIYWVNDPLEWQTPKANYYPVTNGQSRATWDTTRQDYQIYCENRIKNFHSSLQSLQIPCIDVLSDDDLIQIVWQTFPRRTP